MPPGTRQETALQEVRNLLNEANRIINQPNVTRENLRDVRQMLREANRLMDELQTRQAVPRIRQIKKPAPAREEQFRYRITVGREVYDVTLPERLPPREARRRLHDMLLNNELVGAGGRPLLADVRMAGPAQTSQEFNGLAGNARLDNFRDAYLARTYQGGQFVDSRVIRIAAVAR